MDQLVGFLAPDDSCFAYKLQWSFYGLKQSLRSWFGHFSSALIQFGMTRCETDHSIFSFHSSHDKCIYLLYVDEIVITGDDEIEIRQLKEHL